MAEQLDDRSRMALLLSRLAICEFARGDHASAERDLRAAAEHPIRRSASMAFLAYVLATTSRWDEVDAIAETKELWSSPEQMLWHPLALIASGDGRLARGDLAGASEQFGTALAMARETGDADWTVLALRGLARIDRIDARPERALATLRQAYEIANKHLGCQRWCLALILADLIEWEEGRDRTLVEQALRLATSAPMPEIAARIAPYTKERARVETAAD